MEKKNIIKEANQVYKTLNIKKEKIPRPKRETFESYANSFEWPEMFYPSLLPKDTPVKSSSNSTSLK